MAEVPDLPVPDLEPRKITIDEYYEHTPEKLELLEGYLCDFPGPSERRLGLLALLLVNVGLTEAVKLAPEEKWREALERAF